MKKSIILSEATWRALQQIKLDEGHLSMDEVLKRLLERAGY